MCDNKERCRAERVSERNEKEIWKARSYCFIIKNGKE